MDCEDTLPIDNDSNIGTAGIALDGPPSGWAVKFDLPYFVSVRDSMDDPTLRTFATDREAGEDPEPVPYSPRLKPGPTTLGGTPIHLPDLGNLADPFVVPQGQGEALLSFLKRIRNVDRSVVMPGELRPDRGAGLFSSVMIRFNDVLSHTFGTNELARVADTALEIINKFLSQYRRSTGSFWAHSVDKSDVIEFSILRLYHNSPPSSAVHVAPGGGPLIVGSELLVDVERDTDIRTGLATDLETSFSLQLLHSAQEHANRRRYGNAVVDAASSFEVEVASLIRRQLEVEGRSLEEISSVFKNASGGYLGIAVLAKDTLRDELGVDFAGTSAYRDWNTNVVDVRNTVVHTGVQPSRESALTAIRDVGTARAKLLELATSTLGS